jgi:enoyl-CoA hydratase/3-hydroxyacyl-CoA dehydrogenase
MVGQIILDRPHQLNTINLELIEEFEQAIDTLEADEDVRAILLTGAGDRAFSAGADAMGMAGQADPISAIDLSQEGQRVWGKLETLSVPVVVGIDGYCLGGGMELSACADMRIATERSELGQPEFNLGLLPGWGGTQRLKHIVGEGRAKEIIFTADRYEAETMEEYGFLNNVVGNDELDEAALELAEKLASGPPVEAFAFGHLITTDDVIEGVTKLQSDEDPQFEGK